VPRHLAVSDVSSRPYGRASYATMMRPSVCLSSVTYALWLSVESKVLEQKLLLTAYIWEVVYEELIDTKMNDLDLCLEVV